MLWIGLLVSLVAVTCTSRSGDAEREVAGQDAQPLIDSVLAAHGGGAALRRVTAYTMQGHVETARRAGQATTFRTFERPDRLKIVIHYPALVEVRIVDGKRGWRRESSGEYSEASGAPLASMVLQAARADVPWILADRRADVRAIAPLDQKGHTYPGLELPLEEGLTLRVYVDPETHLVTVTQSLLRLAGLETEFGTIYADYRPVDGVMFAFREENFASGTHTGSTFITEVRVNPPLPPNAFSPAP